MPRMIGLGQNVAAFLDMIRLSEIGQPLIDISDGGYNIIVGSTVARPFIFKSYADHPKRFNPAVKSDAAGGYQLMGRYWAYYKHYLSLRDFSPEEQDRVALCLINECKAMQTVRNGDFATAVHMVRSRWASLPGAGYGQHENSIQFLTDAYRGFGGSIAA